MAKSEVVKFERVCQVGFAVKDADKVVEAWKSAFGFDKWRYENIGGKDGKGRPWSARLVHYQFGPMDFELIQPVEGRIAQSRFLDAYGDGIHHIAFPVADVAGEAAKLEKRPDFKLVLKTERFAYFDGPGGTIELVPLRSDTGKPGSGGVVKLGNMCQVGFAVKDADKVVEAWKSAFGFDKWTYNERAGKDAKGRPWRAKLAHYQLGAIDLELVQPAEGRIAQSKFIDTHGDGIHHVAFPVQNVAADTLKLENRPGFKLVLKNERISYIDIPGGVMIELVPPR
ncbi:MAG: VOC family protein [Chloroflexota bacterium]